MALWTTDAAKSHRHAQQIALWLFGVSSLVFAMVVLGGATRITRSGLSMTDWSFTGTLPPMGEAAWQKEFDRYKQFPEYQRINQDMTLSEFKFIYFMEYSHRMFGRFIGTAFALPAFYFFWRHRRGGPLFSPVAATTLAGGALFTGQAFIGWWMVRSGLDGEKHTELDLPRVSPYRLATHLSYAFVIYAFLLTSGLGMWARRGKEFRTFFEQRAPAAASLRRAAALTTGIVGLTAFSGAFVAGTEAGRVYNMFPWMGPPGTLVPSDIVSDNIKPKWKNVFENQATVQFDHRMLAYLSLISCTGLFLYSRRFPLSPGARKLSLSVISVALLQVSLGITTLISGLNPYLASLHQAGSLTLLTACIALLHTLRRGGSAGHVISRRALTPSLLKQAPFKQYARMSAPWSDLPKEAPSGYDSLPLKEDLVATEADFLTAEPLDSSLTPDAAWKPQASEALNRSKSPLTRRRTGNSASDGES